VATLRSDGSDGGFGALQAGTAGFLLKDASPETLTAAIRAVANGHGLIAPEVTRRLIARFAATTPRPRPQPRARQAEPARTQGAAGGRPRQVQRPDRAPAVHRGGHGQSHVSSVLLKLGLHSRVQAVILAYETGLVSPGTPIQPA
jgi:DNA-binding NarL/FixJ family response regulator